MMDKQSLGLFWIKTKKKKGVFDYNKKKDGGAIDDRRFAFTGKCSYFRGELYIKRATVNSMGDFFLSSFATSLTVCF